MSWNLIDSDGFTETWSHVGPDGTHIIERQNDAPILKRNEDLRASEATVNSGFRPIASIPMTLARKWLREDGINERGFWMWPTREQRKYFARKYLSSDYQKLRITPKMQTKLWFSETQYKAVDVANFPKADDGN